jgi:hypothetical protein
MRDYRSQFFEETGIRLSRKEPKNAKKSLKTSIFGTFLAVFPLTLQARPMSFRRRAVKSGRASYSLN